MLYGKENKEPVMQGAYNRLRADMQGGLAGNASGGGLAGPRSLEMPAAPRPLAQLKAKVMQLKQNGAGQLDPALAGEIYDTLAPVLRAEGRR